ncbi:MAG: CDP-glycerol glycerophosphotransferase family protein [Longibaculum sp.]
MKNKKEGHQQFLTDNIVLVDLTHSPKILEKILEIFISSYKEMNIYVIDNGKISDKIKDSSMIKIIKANSNEYLEIIKIAHYIILDSFSSKIVKPKKNQILFHITLPEHNKSLLEIQTLCRFSTLNIMLSQNEAISFLHENGLNDSLNNKCVVFDYIQFPQEFIELLFSFDEKEIRYFVESENKNIFIYINKFNNKHQEALITDYLRHLDCDLYNYYIVSNDPTLNQFVKKINNNFGFIVYVKGSYNLKEKVLLKLSVYSHFFEKIFKTQTKKIYQKTIKKNLKGFQIDEIIDFFDGNMYTCHELGNLKCKKTFLDINPYYIGIKSNSRWYKKNVLFKKKNYDSSFQLPLSYANEEKETFYNLSVDFYRIFSKLKKSNHFMNVIIYFRVKSLFKFPITDCTILLNDKEVKSRIKKGLFFHKVTITLSDELLLSLPAQNKIFFKYADKDEFGFVKNIRYKSNEKNKYLKSKIINVDGKTSCYLRQSLKNRLYLTVRPHNRTDGAWENFKIDLAYYLSFLFRKKKIYLLYEKDSSRYEESASVLYETLINQGYQNAYFILDKNYQDYDKIEKKYLKNIINKYSFKHYLYFFISNNFFGSELMVHSMELRIMNKHVLKKINSKNVNNVFLQHGVMYMISLDSDSRKYFTPRQDGKGKFRVVTSSQKEANHFVELGHYDEKQVIICGLPKYDRNILYPNANKIVIMPTWRPWEYNQATTDFRQTRYYQMLERIVDGISEEYKKNLIILPHPLFYKAAEGNDFELKKYMLFNVKYDEILRDTKVLITDYSSIAYDAFYRGSRVIFYWEEIDECLKNYGSNTKLMLNEKNIFGDICYNSQDLENILKENYEQQQKDEYVKKYNELVEFHDGKNTERLIQYLKTEKIL